MKTRKMFLNYFCMSFQYHRLVLGREIVAWSPTSFYFVWSKSHSYVFQVHNINPQKKLLSQAIWVCFWQTSSNLEDYNNLDFTILNCTSLFKMHLHPKNWQRQKAMVYYSTTSTSKLSVCLFYLGYITLQKALFIFEAGSPHSCKLS